MKNQLSVKDNQISTLTQLADQAQKLNLVDKPQLMQKDEKNKSNVSAETKTSKKRWWNFFGQ